MEQDFFDDLEGLGEEPAEEEEEQLIEEVKRGSGGLKRGREEEEEDEDDEDDDKQDEEEEEIPEEDKKEAAMSFRLLPLAELTKTFNSRVLSQVLEKIAGYLQAEEEGRAGFEIDTLSGVTSGNHPEYSTIVQANSLMVDLSHEISQVIQKIKAIFSPRFSELEKLILNPFHYAKACLLLQNTVDLTSNSLIPSSSILDQLKSFLSNAIVMVISVTMSTSDGRLLSPKELKDLREACEMLERMDEVKGKLLGYVASRMALVAPNLSVLLGSATAAKIMGLSGGLIALSKIPACNLLVLGAQKSSAGGNGGVATALGMSRLLNGAHTGHIYECDLVLKAPVHVRRKAARLLSAKAALACRCDLSREYPTGRMGAEFREDVEKKIALLIEPPPAKKVKALPLPIEHKKRRGGKRARKAKERMAPSELQKAANRMSFGDVPAEIEIGEHLGSTIGLGQVGGNTGKLKLAHKDFKIPLSKKHRQITTNIASGSSAISNPNSGIMSSVAFTPIKGIELENPDIAAQQRKLKAILEKNSYFSAVVFKKSQ